MRGVERPYNLSEDSPYVPCTSCNYCTPHCPENIPIPKMMSALTSKRTVGHWSPGWGGGFSRGGIRPGGPEDCNGCGKCESVCPQHLPIRKLLKELAE